MNCDGDGCVMLAETDFGKTKLCMRCAAREPGQFTLLPVSGVLNSETRVWRLPRYVSKRELDKMRLIMKLIGAGA